MSDEAGAGGPEHQNEPRTPVRRSNGGPNAADRGEKSSRTTRSEERKLARVTRGWSLFFQGAVALATLVYVVFSVLLWIETRKAVELTRRSVEATEKALAATEESNRLTATALDATEESNRLTRQGIEATKSLGEESNRLTAESLEVSRQSADAAQRALQITERAQLAISESEVVTFEVEKKLVVKNTLRNDGRIPASVTQLRLRGWVILEGGSAPALPEGTTEWASSIIGPNRTRDFFSTFSFTPSAELVAQYQEGRALVLFVGDVTYVDDLGGPYILPTCFETWLRSEIEQGVGQAGKFTTCSAAREAQVRGLLAAAENKNQGL